MGASELRHIFARLASQPSAVHQVGWRDRLQQSAYLDTLAGILAPLGERGNNTVLDVGCGQGDLYAFLLAGGFRGSYTGIDLSPELVARARQKFPAASFVLGDALDAPLEIHDWVLASGLFDYRTSDSPTRLRATLRRMFDLARLGLAWNMFAVLPPGRPDLYHEPPGELLKLCDELTPHWVLRHDYDPAHLTFYLYPRKFFLTDNLVRLIGRLYLQPDLRAAIKHDPAQYAQEYDLTFQQLNVIAALLE